MKNLVPALLLGVLVALCIMGLSACIPPAPTPTPFPMATLTPSVAPPTRVPFSYDGQWDAGTLPDGLIQGELIFQVEKDRFTVMSLNYTLRYNGCTVESSINGTADEFAINGNQFTAAMYGEGGWELSLAGTFVSPKEANGTLKFKGTFEDCGPFERNAKWNGENGPIPPTATPTLVRPTETPTPTWTPFVFPTIPVLTPTPASTLRPDLQPLVNAIEKTRAVKVFKLTENLSGPPALLHLPADPAHAEPSLMYQEGQVNGNDTHFVVKGAFVTLFGGEPAKGFEFLRVAGKGYIHGPMALLNAPEDKWYPADSGELGMFSLTPLSWIESFANETGIWNRFEKSSTGTTLDGLRCDVYAGGPEAASDLFKVFAGRTTTYVVDQGKIEIDVCGDGYLHAFTAKWSGHDSTTQQPVTATLTYHISDLNGDIHIQAPSVPVAPATSAPRNTPTGAPSVRPSAMPSSAPATNVAPPTPAR